MRAKLLLLGLLLAFTCSCGGSDVSEGPLAFVETTTSLPATTTVAPTTTTTSVAPTTTTTTTAAPTTTTTTEPGPLFPLTGEPIGDGNSTPHAAIVVKINNNDGTARAALRGIDKADIVFEERIEQKATRFAAVFHSELPTEVGSVRSARTSDIDIVANLNRPVFAFSGANDGVMGQVRAAQRNGLLNYASEDNGNWQFGLVSGFRRPNKTVVSVEGLASVATVNTGPSPIYDYSDNVSELGAPSPGVFISARVEANFVWDAVADGYRRYQGRTVHKTRDGVQVTPQNVVVMTTQYRASRIDAASVDAISVGSGRVVVYSDGHRVEGTWSRPTRSSGYTLTAANGELIGLAPGQTWVSMTPPGTDRELTAENAASFG